MKQAIKMTVKVLEDRTFTEGRYLTFEFPEAPSAQELAPEDHRGSRAPDLPAPPPAAAPAEAAAGDAPQR
jgi:hypothetical protein